MLAQCISVDGKDIGSLWIFSCEAFVFSEKEILQLKGGTEEKDGDKLSTKERV